MFSLSTLELVLLILVICFAGFLGFFWRYPLVVLEFIGALYNRKKRSVEDVMAVPVMPRIAVEYYGPEEKKPALMNDLKEFLENKAEEAGIEYEIQDLDNSGEGQQLEIVFVPEEDQEDPDLSVDDPDGPEVREEDDPEDSEGYVRLRDL